TSRSRVENDLASSCTADSTTIDHKCSISRSSVTECDEATAGTVHFPTMDKKSRAVGACVRSGEYCASAVCATRCTSVMNEGAFVRSAAKEFAKPARIDRHGCAAHAGRFGEGDKGVLVDGNAGISCRRMIIKADIRCLARNITLAYCKGCAARA